MFCVIDQEKAHCLPCYAMILQCYLENVKFMFDVEEWFLVDPCYLKAHKTKK